MSTPAETLAAAMRVQGRDYARVAYGAGIVSGLLLALGAVVAGLWLGAL